MVNFETLRDKLAPKVEALYQDYFVDAVKRGSPAVSEMSTYHFKTGGKRFRALIPSYVYENLGRKGEDLLYFGAAVEMIHNATLVHDDLQDGDELRRGSPTVWKKYSSAQAINCGDAMFQYANDLMLRLELEPRVILTLVQDAAMATLNVIEGQAQEFIMKDEPYPTVDRYFGVIRGKTSGLFALPVVGALTAAKMPEDIKQATRRASQELGVLFQVQDDYLDLYGEKGRDKKATDIAEGKISFFAAHVFERGNNNQRQKLQEILKKPRAATTDSDIATALTIIESTGAKQEALTLIHSVQETLHKDKFLKEQAPGVHHALSELSDIFLKPIQGC